MLPRNQIFVLPLSKLFPGPGSSMWWDWATRCIGWAYPAYFTLSGSWAFNTCCRHDSYYTARRHDRIARFVIQRCKIVSSKFFRSFTRVDRNYRTTEGINRFKEWDYNCPSKSFLRVSVWLWYYFLILQTKSRSRNSCYTGMYVICVILYGLQSEG